VNITSEVILNRKAALEKELGDILDRANSISGAIQDCDYWLAMLSKEEIKVDDGVVEVKE
jgi:hypothetical protein